MAAPTTALRRLGLRARIIIAFTLGALLLSAVLTVVTYTRLQELIAERERAAISQVYGNARSVRDQLLSAEPDVVQVLSSLQTPAASRPLVRFQGRWIPLNLDYGESALPAALRDTVLGGRPALMRYELRGRLQLAVGVPLPAVGAAYFEIVDFSELERALAALGLSLLAGALVAALAGAAVGGWGSRRVLRPLADVAAAAHAITGGQLDTRLQPTHDRDLNTLIDSFNDMVEALQARIERDTRFASDVSHELRSPLTTLSASIEVLSARRDEMPERARAALDLLVADVARFNAMVEDLLEISRVDAGAASLHLEPVRIAELVLHAVSSSTEDDVPVDVDAEAADAVVVADKRRMVRVVANLLDNAGRYGGGATGVGLSVHGSAVRITVDDEGPGVDPADRQHVFERFARGGTAAGNRGRGEGAGLGLALVREHVHLHGGEVWVEDGPGGTGARFVVELPLAAPQAEPGALDGTLAAPDHALADR